jgi:hypothetical protein
MKMLVVVLIVTFVLSSAAQAVIVTASQGKVIQYKNDSGVWVAEDRLATRTAGVWGEDTVSNTLDAKKSYLQFNLNDLYAANPGLKGNITSASLSIYAKGVTGKNYLVSGLNDGDAAAEAWSYTTINWFTAPGHVTTSGNGLDATKTALLYEVTAAEVLPDVASTKDVTAFLNTDTDGLVTFIFTAGGTAYMYNAIAGGNYNAAYVPVLTIVPEPATMLLLGLGGLISLRRRQS